MYAANGSTVFGGGFTQEDTERIVREGLKVPYQRK